MNTLKLITVLYFGPATRKRLYKKLAAQLKNDISLLFALEMQRDRFKARKSPLAKVLDQIVAALHEGCSLDVALTDFIPPNETMLIRGGVASGRLPQTLELCVQLISARQDIINSVVEALAYPVVLFSLFMALLTILSVHVVPQLTAISSPEAWGGAAYVLYAVSNFVASPLGVFCMILVCTVFIVSLASLPFWTGSLRLRVEQLPPWSFYRLISGCIWLFTVSTLMRAGLQLDTILGDMLGNRLSPWLAERLMAIRVEYTLGKDFGQCLYDCGMEFPDRELVEDMYVYAKLPGFDARLHDLSLDWLKEGTEKIKTDARVLNTSCICAMLGLLCGLAVSVASLQEQLTNMGAM